MLFTVEGNIGAGKSTLLKSLETETFCAPHIVLYEPVEEWMNVKPEGPDSMSLFEKYYTNKGRYGFMFQMYALQTRVNHLLNTINNNKDKIIICERTHLTDCEIFAKMLAQGGIMDKTEYFVYKSWYDDCTQRLNGVIKGAIYLRTTPPICMTRIAKRSREGEENISVQYIKTLHELHDEWLFNDHNHPDLPVCVINGDLPQDHINFESISEFVNTRAQRS